MLTVSLSIALLLLVVVLIQDVKSREVWLLVFPLLFLVNAVIGFVESTAGDWMKETFYNLLLVGGNLILASVYFSIKFRKPTFVTQRLMGWGDVLFFICLCPLFPFYEFCVFFPISLIFSLLVWLPVIFWQKEQSNRIPLAGLQAIPVMGLLFAKLFGVEINFAVPLSTVFQ